MVNHHLQDGQWSPTIQNLPEGSVVQTLNLESRPDSLRPASKAWSLVTHLSLDGHPSSLEWSPIIRNIVTHLPKCGHPLCQGISPKHGHPPTKINQILKNLKELQPNKEFDTSAAQLINFFLCVLKCSWIKILLNHFYQNLHVLKYLHQFKSIKEGLGTYLDPLWTPPPLV